MKERERENEGQRFDLEIGDAVLDVCLVLELTTCKYLREFFK